MGHFGKGLSLGWLGGVVDKVGKGLGIPRVNVVELAPVHGCGDVGFIGLLYGEFKPTPGEIQTRAGEFHPAGRGIFSLGRGNYKNSRGKLETRGI